MPTPSTTRSHENRPALVTGGASGIGFAIAQRLAQEGAHVTLWDIDENALGVAQKEMLQAGLECLVHAVDVTDETAIRDALSKMKEAPSLVVHSAGIAGPTGTFVTDIDEKDYDRVYQVNQKSFFLVAKNTVATMKERGFGRIVAISSIAGKDGNPMMAPYTSTKAAVIGLVKGLGKEFADTGVTINAIAPAVIQTPMNEGTSDEQLKYMIAKIPMGRLGTTDEVAALASFICSQEASFTTGFCYDLSGGRAVY